jgi:hypothetical protein
MKANPERITTMRLSINPTGIAGFFETRIRRARIAHQHARLRRELARLPTYVARDIGAGPNQDRFVNFLDD